MTDLQAHLQAGLAGRYTVEREIGRGGMATVFLDPFWDPVRADSRFQRLAAVTETAKPGD